MAISRSSPASRSATSSSSVPRASRSGSRHADCTSNVEPARSALRSTRATVGQKRRRRPVLEVEQSLDPAAFPHRGVERRDEGTGIDSAGERRVGVQVSRLGPPLDIDHVELAVGDQLAQDGSRLRHRVAPDIGQVTGGAQPVDPGGAQQQSAVRFLVRRCRGLEDLAGNGVFGRAVDPLEVAAPSSADAPGPEQVLEGLLGIAPVPPWPLASTRFLQVTGGNRAVVEDRPLELGHQPRSFVGDPRWSARGVPVGHAPPQVGVVVDVDQ